MTGPVGGVTVTVDQTSVLGTISNAGPIDFCSATGDWSSVPVSVSGSVGTINWQYGWSNGAGGTAGNGWQFWSPTGVQPGYCCFPKKVAVSDGNADRVRWTVTNGVCPTVGPSAALLVQNKYNEDPTSLSSNQNNYCTGTVANITLTATFPAATAILGNVEFFSGACSGIPIATVAGNGTTSVVTTITAPTATTTYYARYNPGTGSGCAPGNCVSTTVNVSQQPVAGTIIQSPASGGTVCNGSNVTYTLSGHSGTFTQYKYQWNASGGVPGSYTNWYASNPAIWPSSQNGASVLHVIAEVTNGTCPPAYTAPVNVTVLSTVNNGGTISAPTTICAGTSASITNVTAATTGTPASTGPTYYYYWERTTAPVVGWTLYETTTALTSALPVAVTGTVGTYNLVRNSAFDCAGQVNSNVLTLTVNGAPAAPTSVTASPSTITQGSSTNLNATSSGTISWYTTPSGVSPFGTSASGANFPISPSVTTTYYAETSGVTAGSQTFSYTGSIVNWNVPAGVTSIDIEAWGAQGGNSSGTAGGLGARIKGTFSVTPGQTLKILVGGQGGTGTQGGGGGGTFVTTSANAALCIAGGGGGGYYPGYSSSWTNSHGTTSTTGQNGVVGINGTIMPSGTAGPNGGLSDVWYYGQGAAGGGGLSGNGANGLGNYGYAVAIGGAAFTNGGAGGAGAGSGGNGGFGGGGGGEWLFWTGGGGGGGYGGGGGGVYYGVGGGGSSYNGGTNQSNSSGVQSGNGQVVISWNIPGCPSATRVPVTVTVNPCAYTPGSQTFNYTGGVQTYTVPCNVTSITIQTWGAQGGNAQYGGGLGGYASGNLAVSANSTFSVYVGGQGSGASGGYNGGGASGGCGAGGGGASDVRNSGGTKLIIAAGGGGGGCDMYGFTGSSGGAGGGTSGGTSSASSGGWSSGDGGTQSAGGASTGCCSVGTAGTWGQGGSGAGIGCGYYPGNGGGGGGGYYGGGGGGNCGGNVGGGGGSSYTGGVSAGSTTAAQRSGNGQVTISW